MRIRFLETARIELDDAIEYYNYEVPGLGDAFLTEVLNALDRIGKYPEAWQPCSKRTRRYQIRRFPYGIMYQIRKDEILVVAFANCEKAILDRKPILGYGVFQQIEDYDAFNRVRVAFGTELMGLRSRPHDPGSVEPNARDKCPPNISLQGRGDEGRGDVGSEATCPKLLALQNIKVVIVSCLGTDVAPAVPRKEGPTI